MTSLEIRYRRLLRVYPAGHRADYEEEMIGVLMSGSEPGRRFPAPAEAFDLLRAGLTARLGRAVRTQRRTGWRDAAAVVSLLVAAFLATLAARRLGLGVLAVHRGDPMRAFGVDGLLLLDVVARCVVWSAVVAAALLGRRRVTAAAAVLAGIVEVTAQTGWAVAQQGHFLLSWHLAGVLLAVVCAVAAAPAVPARESLGRRGVAAVLAASGAAVVVGLPNGIVPWWLAGGLTVGPDHAVGLPSPAFLATFALLLVALWRLATPVRRRVLVLLAPVVAVVLLQSSFWLTHQAVHWFGDPLLTQAVVTPGVAAATVAVGVAMVRRRERRAGGARA